MSQTGVAFEYVAKGNEEVARAKVLIRMQGIPQWGMAFEPQVREGAEGGKRRTGGERVAFLRDQCLS